MTQLGRWGAVAFFVCALGAAWLVGPDSVRADTEGVVVFRVGPSFHGDFAQL
jgi:hypothetical protein